MGFFDRVLRADVAEKPAGFIRGVLFVLGAVFLIAGVAGMVDFLKGLSKDPFGWTEIGELALSVLFLVGGLLVVGYALFAGSLYRRGVALRAAAADRAEAEGALGVAEELRSPDRWDSDDRGLVFLDGERQARGMNWMLMNIIWNGGLLGAAPFLIGAMFRGEEKAVFVALCAIPFVAFGVCFFVAMMRALRAPRMPDFVFIASPVYPSTKPLDVHLQWAFLGDESQLNDLEELAIGVVSFDGEFLSKKVLSCAGLEALPREQLQAGTMTVTLPKIERKGRFAKIFHWAPQGSTDLLVRAKSAGRPELRESLILGQVTGA